MFGTLRMVHCKGPVKRSSFKMSTLKCKVQTANNKIGEWFCLGQ